MDRPPYPGRTRITGWGTVRCANLETTSLSILDMDERSPHLKNRGPRSIFEQYLEASDIGRDLAKDEPWSTRAGREEDVTHAWKADG